FNDGAVGTVSAATATSLTVTFSTRPTGTGNLTATVTDSVGSSPSVQVATVFRVNRSSANLPINAATITIAGSGFLPQAGDDTVVFNDGATGMVTTASATSLTVTFTTPPLAVGPLTALIGSGGAPVQVATVTPVVTSTPIDLAADAPQMTINGL